MKIESIKDPRIIHARKLSSAAGRSETKEFLLQGKEQIEWALRANVPITMVFIHDKIDDNQLQQKFEYKKIPYFFVSEVILKKITDTNYLVPLVGVAKNPIVSTHNEDFVIVLDNLVDHGNIGTIIRSGLAFGIHSFISTSITADFFYKKIIDASRGNIFTSSIKKFVSEQETINYLKSNGYQIVATSPHGNQIQSLLQLHQKPVALIVGNETEGCSSLFLEQADFVTQIPMSSEVESLNVAIAAGISIYELKIKSVIAMLIQKIYKNIGRQIGVTGQLIRTAFDKELQAVTDFSALQVILLMILKCDQVMTLEQVSRDVGEFGAELIAFLQPLQKKGYISNAVSQEKPAIILTDAGQEYLSKLWPIVDKIEQKILNNFSENERIQFFEYISRIQNNCQQIIKDHSSNSIVKDIKK